MDTSSNNQKLIQAVKRRSVTKTRELIASGADVDYYSDNAAHLGRNSLLIAASQGDTAIVKILLQEGASPDAFEGYYKKTSLGHALLRGDTEIIKTLLQHGAEIGYAYNGCDLDTIKQKLKNTEILKIVLEAGIGMTHRINTLQLCCLNNQQSIAINYPHHDVHVGTFIIESLREMNVPEEFFQISSEQMLRAFKTSFMHELYEPKFRPLYEKKVLMEKTGVGTAAKKTHKI